MVRKFTAVVLFRDTPKERKFALKSIPSLVALNPDKIVVGIDDDRDEDFDRFVEKIFNGLGYGSYALVPVARDPSWQLHTAHVLWECLQAAGHDVVFACNIDTIIRPAVLDGLDMIGQDNLAMMSFSLWHKVRTVPDRIRRFYFQRQTKREATLKGTSGTYWIYLPFLLKAIDYDEYRSVANGFDSLIYFQFLKNGYRCIFSHTVGAKCMDYENDDLPWRQFCRGAWYMANCTSWYAQSRPLRCIRRVFGDSAFRKAFWVRAALGLVPDIWKTQYYGMWAGYWHAVKNPESELVQSMRGVTWNEYSLKWGGGAGQIPKKMGAAWNGLLIGVAGEWGAGPSPCLPARPNRALCRCAAPRVSPAHGALPKAARTASAAPPRHTPCVPPA